MTTDEPTCNIKHESMTANLLRQCKVIFWDEATMMNKRALEAVDRTLQDIRKRKNIFGGILIILMGDFRQTLPVVRGGCRPDEVSSCIKWSYPWQNVKAYYLTTNMRVHLHNDRNKAQFAQTLLKVGNSEMPYQKTPTSLQFHQILQILQTISIHSSLPSTLTYFSSLAAIPIKCKALTGNRLLETITAIYAYIDSDISLTKSLSLWFVYRHSRSLHLFRAMTATLLK